MDKQKILLFADWFEPGFKAGGPIRSCVNFVQHMKEYYQVYVFTTDRDLGEVEPYPGIETDKWIRRDDGAGHGYNAYYCSPAGLSMKGIRDQISTIDPDHIYLNSMFSRYFTIYPLLANRWLGARARVVLSPRGMLRESATQFKPLKKKIFFSLFRRMGLHKSIRFHASDETEQKDVKRYFGRDASVTLISNLPGMPVAVSGNTPKVRGELSMVFVGRIHPIKNLDYLLECMRPISSRLKLTIAGSAEDKEFWEKCRQIIAGFPSNIEVQYIGEIASDKIADVIREHHIFALPTRGENFGHAIFEALSLKKPVLISDQTPWRGLDQQQAGWDIPLQEPTSFEKAIREASGWDQAEYDRWAENALNLAIRHRQNSNALEKYRQLFS